MPSERLMLRAMSLTMPDDGFVEFEQSLIAADFITFLADNHSGLIESTFANHGIDSTLNSFCQSHKKQCYGEYR